MTKETSRGDSFQIKLLTRVKNMKYSYLLLIIMFTVICRGLTVMNPEQVAGNPGFPLSEAAFEISPLINTTTIGAEAGRIEVQINGIKKTIVDLSSTGTRHAQQVVYVADKLPPGEHTISIVNRGPGPVAVDAVLINHTVNIKKKPK